MTFNPPITMKHFCLQWAEAQGVTRNCIFNRIRRGQIVLKVRRENARVVWVLAAEPALEPGEIRLKSFCQAEAARLKCGMTNIYMRIRRGKYPRLKMRRLTARIIFVKPI
jgi:hypothetical protein